MFQNRPSGAIAPQKVKFAKDFKNMAKLEDVCAELKPSVAIGAAAISGAFTDQFLRDMGKFNKRPIIFALSNPTSKAECTAEQAYKLTEVRIEMITQSILLYQLIFFLNWTNLNSWICWFTTSVILYDYNKDTSRYC